MVSVLMAFAQSLGFLSLILIADLDPNGLAIASSLGLSIYDLGIRTKEHLRNGERLFDLVIAVQVLEHFTKSI